MHALTNDEFLAAVEKLSNFMRSVGQSDEERDLLSIRLGVKTRGWRGRFNRNAVTDRDRANIAQALIDIQKWD